jgi:hypothetical protein
MATRSRLCVRLLAVALALLVAGPAMAKSPTRLVSFVVEAKIYTKFLFINSPITPGNGFQGEINGIATEFEMNIRGYVSDRVEAFARVQSRLGADWSDYFLQVGAGGEGGPPDDDADYMKFRGAFVKIKDNPLPTRPTIWIGSSDIDMFSPFTIGRIRFTERDNAKGVFIRGELGPGVYDIGRVSMPRLWAGPGFNLGEFNTRDFAYGLAYDVRPTDKLRVELFGSYARDQEFLGIKIDGDPVLSGGIGGPGTAKYAARYENLAGNVELTYDISDNLYFNGFAGMSSTRNNSGGAGLFSPVLHPKPDDLSTSNDEGDTLSGGFGIARLEAYNIAGTPLSISAEGFFIGQNFSSVMAARREVDVLLTQGFSHDINFTNDSGIFNGMSGSTVQVATINADNDFVDFTEDVAESAIGWKGFTLVPKYESGRLRITAEATFLGYDTNAQGRDLDVYPTFEFAGGGSVGVVDSTGTLRGVRDVYNRNQDRKSQIFSAAANYKFDLFRTSDVTASFKYVKDEDKVDINDPTDDYKGTLPEFLLALRSQVTGELELTLGAKIYRYEEENALYARSWDPPRRSQLIADRLNIDRDKVFFRAQYRFGAADIGYLLEYWNETRDILAGPDSAVLETKGRMRSIATVSVGF